MKKLVSWLLLVYSLLSFVSSECHFTLGIYKYRNETMILQGDLIGCQDVQNCHTMFVKIALECENKESIEYNNLLVQAGLEPHFHFVEEGVKEDERVSIIHHVDPVRTQDENSCFCVIFASNDNSSCLNEFCNNIWYAPFPLHNTTNFVDVTISTNGVGGSHINARKERFYIMRNIRLLTQSIIPTNLLVGIETSNFTLKKSGYFWYVVLASDSVMYTTNEFYTTRYVQIDTKPNVTMLCEGISTSTLTVVESTVLVLSKNGLLKVNQDLSNEVVSTQCFIKLIHLDKKMSIALTLDDQEIYSISLSGSSGIFAKNLSISIWLQNSLQNQDIELVDVCSFREDQFLVLLRDVNASKFLIVKGSTSNGSFLLLNNNIKCKPSVASLYSSVLSNIFLFGEDCLLYSSNFGVTFHKVIYDNSTVVSLHANQKGFFVFKTLKSEVWVCRVGLFVAKRLSLHYGEGERSVEIFFDSNSQLKELVLNSTGRCLVDCIKPRTHSIVDILHNSNTAEWRYTGKGECPYRGSCDRAALQRESIFPEVRICMYDFTSVDIHSNLNFYSRTKTVLHVDQTRFKFKTLDAVTKGNVWAKVTDLKSPVFELFSHQFHFLPERIALDRAQCFEFDMNIFLQNDPSIDTYWGLDDVKLAPQSASPLDVIIRTEKKVDFLKRSVTFNIKACDSGIRRSLRKPGFTHVANKVTFQILPTPIECLTEAYVEMTTPLLIDHGCPTRQRVTIDFQKSKRETNHFCEEEFCFYFDKIFDPVFLLVDEITQQSVLYVGQKNLTVIGGGASANSVRMFTPQEIHDYNYKLGATLVWALSGGVYSWLCGSLSPCGSITPTFPESPHYYLLLRFTNIEPTTNCDYSFKFLIKVHGMPPDGIYPSMFVVVLCLSIMGGIVVSAYFLQGKYGPLIRLFRQWKGRVNDILHQSTNHNRGGEGERLDSVTKVNSWMELNQLNKVVEKGTSMHAISPE